MASSAGRGLGTKSEDFYYPGGTYSIGKLCDLFLYGYWIGLAIIGLVLPLGRGAITAVHSPGGSCFREVPGDSLF